MAGGLTHWAEPPSGFPIPTFVVDGYIMINPCFIVVHGIGWCHFVHVWRHIQSCYIKPMKSRKKNLRRCVVFSLPETLYQWIGRDILKENTIFNGKNHGFRLRFSLKPIHWRQGTTAAAAGVGPPIVELCFGAAWGEISWLQRDWPRGHLTPSWGFTNKNWVFVMGSTIKHCGW